MRHIDHFLGYFDVVVVAGNGFAIGFQTAVHHDRAETQIDGALTHIGALTMVLVHHHGNVGVRLNSGLNEQLQKTFASIFARTCRGLHDDGRTRFFGSLHDGLDLLQVVDVESWNAVAVDGRMVQQLAHRNECHDESPKVKKSFSSLGVATISDGWSPF